MRLYEFANTDPLIPKLIAVSDQLKVDLSNDKVDPDSFTVSQFLTYLQKYDITLDKLDLYNMIKKPPLNHLIDNIQGDHIVFKGFESPEVPDDEANKIVKSMADKARK